MPRMSCRGCVSAPPAPSCRLTIAAEPSWSVVVRPGVEWRISDCKLGDCNSEPEMYKGGSDMSPLSVFGEGSYTPPGRGLRCPKGKGLYSERRSAVGQLSGPRIVSG